MWCGFVFFSSGQRTSNVCEMNHTGEAQFIDLQLRMKGKTHNMIPGIKDLPELPSFNLAISTKKENVLF